MKNKSTLKQRISEIQALKENLDGYGASVPNENVVNNAFKFIDYAYINKFDFISSENIAPTSYGTIVFDFKTKKGMVSVEVGESKIGFFTEYSDKNKKDIISDGDVIDNENIISDELNEALTEIKINT